MFAKLFKHEFLATWRTLATVIGVVFGVSLTLLIPAWLHIPIAGGAGRTLSMFGFMCGGVIVAILLAINYWRTMYSGPGYFTHSLPVRGRTIFAAKVTYAVLAVLVSWVLSFALAILLPGRAVGGDVWTQLVQIWDQTTQVVSVGTIWAIIAVMLVVYGAQFVVYLCGITLGTRGELGRLGLGGVVIGLIIAYFACQILTAIVLVAVPLGIRIAEPGFGDVVFKSMGTEIFRNQTPDVFGIGWLPAYVLLAIGAFIFAAHSVEKHTNLA